MQTFNLDRYHEIRRALNDFCTTTSVGRDVVDMNKKRIGEDLVKLFRPNTSSTTTVKQFVFVVANYNVRRVFGEDVMFSVELDPKSIKNMGPKRWSRASQACFLMRNQHLITKGRSDDESSAGTAVPRDWASVVTTRYVHFRPDIQKKTNQVFARSNTNKFNFAFWFAFGLDVKYDGIETNSPELTDLLRSLDYKEYGRCSQACAALFVMDPAIEFDF